MYEPNIYKITKPVTKIYELEIKSNITLPYGVVMELKNYIRGLVPNGFHSNLTKEARTILKNYENEMSGIDTTNLEVKGALIHEGDDDVNDNNVDITGEFLQQKPEPVDFLETETDVYEFGQTVSNEDWSRGVGTSRVKKENF